MMRFPCGSFAALFVFFTPALQAQDELRPDHLRSLVTAISADSTVGRNTPSPELEKAARFIAAQFQSIGLKPLGDDDTFFQRYPVEQTIIESDSASIQLGQGTVWRFGSDFRHIGGTGDPTGRLEGEVVILTGAVTRENAESLGLANKVVIYAGPLNTRGRLADYRAAFAPAAAGARAVIIAATQPDSLWQTLKAEADEFKPASAAAWPVWTANRPQREGYIRFFPMLELWRGRFSRILREANVDSASIYSADGTPKVTSLGVNGTIRFGRRIASIAYPANVVGVMEGSDPILKHEYLVYTAHLDGLGRERGGRTGPETILNGADDNASGVAIITQIAKAFRGSRIKPMRSVIFVAVSGEEHGLWGSDHFASHPPVPKRAIIGNFNFDMVGRSVADSVYILGLGDSAFGKKAAAVLRSHPRGLTILDEAAVEKRFPGMEAGQRSDMVNFIRRGVPAIHFFTGWHDDYHATTDDADKLNYEAMSRIAKAGFDIGFAASRR